MLWQRTEIQESYIESKPHTNLFLVKLYATKKEKIVEGKKMQKKKERKIKATELIKSIVIFKQVPITENVLYRTG